MSQRAEFRLSTAMLRGGSVAAVATSLAVGLRDGLATRFPLPVTCSLEECLELSGQSDMHSYLLAGRDLANGVTPASGDSAWIYRLWPPGMPVLDAVAITVTNGEHIVYFMATITFALWFLALAIPILAARRATGILVAGVIGVAIPNLYFMTSWPIGEGLLTSDGISTALVLLGAYSWLATQRRIPVGRKRLLVAATVTSLTSAAYVRSVGEILANFIAIAVTMWMIATLARLAWRQEFSLDALRPSLRRAIVIAAVVQAMLIPWRVYMHEYLGGGWTFSVYGDYLWREAWTPAERWGKDALTIRFTGRDHMCEAYPTTCKSLAIREAATDAPFSGAGYLSDRGYRDLYLETLRSDPAPWLRSRWDKFPLFFGLDGSTRGTAFVALIGAIGTWLLGVIVLLRRRDPVLLILASGIVVAVLGPIAVTHFEARYFLLVQLLGMIGTFALVSNPRPLHVWLKRPFVNQRE